MYYRIRVERRVGTAMAYNDFNVGAADYDSAKSAAERTLREHYPGAKFEWRGLVCFVNSKPTEEELHENKFAAAPVVSGASA